MNQELEQRVNEIVRTTNVSFQEALQQVQNEIGQEEAEGVLEEGQKKNSNSSGGQFQYVDPVSLPQRGVTAADRFFSSISPLGTTAEEASISRYNREVDQYNNDPQSFFGLDSTTGVQS